MNQSISGSPSPTINLRDQFHIVGRDHAVRDEDGVPYDGQTKAERQGRYMAGFVIVPVELRSLPVTVDIGDKKKPVPRAAMTGVYVELAAYVREHNVVWPSVKTLAESCGYSDDYTARVLVALEKCGAITKSHRDLNGMKRSNQYTLNHQKPPENQIPPTAATLPLTAGQDTADSGNVPAHSGTNVEEGNVEERERRESAAKPKPAKSRRKPETSLPGDFTLTAERIAYAQKQGMSERRAAIQFQRFQNHAEQNDRRCRDWNAAWRNWVLSDIERHGKDTVEHAGMSKAFATGRRVF